MPLLVQNNVLLAIRSLRLQAREFYISPNRLCGLIELNPAETRPNSGPGQSERDTDNRQNDHDFDERKTAASIHIM